MSDLSVNKLFLIYFRDIKLQQTNLLVNALIISATYFIPPVFCAINPGFL